MSARTSKILAIGLVAAAVITVAVMWQLREPPPLPPDHSQIEPGDRFDNAEDAVDYYRTLVRREPDNAAAQVRLAHALMQYGEESGTQFETVPEAQQLLEGAVEARPGDIYARALLASLYNILHRFEDGRDLSRELLEERPYFAYVHGTLIDALVELGEYDEAVEASDRLQSLKPGLPAYSRASYIRELYGDTEGAIEAMQLAANAAPIGRSERSWALFQLGNLYLGDAKPDTARVIFEGALEEMPDFAPALAGLGHVALVEGDADRAVQLIEEARSLRPMEMMDELLVEAYAAAGDQAQSDAAAERVLVALQRARDMGEIVDMEEADFLLDLGRDLEGSLVKAREQQARRPGHMHANETLAWALHKNGRSAEGIPYIERAMRLDTGDAMVHYRAAQIYEGAGQLDEAARHYRIALDGNLDVESPTTADEARVLLGRIEA